VSVVLATVSGAGVWKMSAMIGYPSFLVIGTDNTLHHVEKRVTVKRQYVACAL
jgi:hypothetical protein